jgi:RNA polymerase-binding transcription factor DksA
MAKPAPKKAEPAATSARKAAAPKPAAVKKAGPAKTAAAKAPAKAAAAPAKAPVKKAAPAVTAPAKTVKVPAAKAASKAPAKAPAKAATSGKVEATGTARAKDGFDAKFLEAQRKLLLEERASLLGQAEVLEGEAASLMEDLEPGDVQFDDESGEGDSIVVERERDLALSAQAREMVSQIDAALARLDAGTYGYSLVSGRPIPKERLKAIPWATELVEEKVGGLGRR